MGILHHFSGEPEFTKAPVVSPLGELPLRVMAVIASPAAWPRPSAAPFAACPATAATAQIYQIHHRLPGPCWISWRIWRKHMGPSRKNTFKIIYERHILNKTASKFGTSKNTRYKSYQIISNHHHPAFSAKT